MQTQCSPTEMAFGRAGGRRIVADFVGGMVSSDAGALLLGETDRAIGLTGGLAACRLSHPPRLHHPRRTGLSAFRAIGRPVVVPPDQPPLRAYLDHRHYQSRLR